MANASSGVILFSLGFTGFQSKDIPVGVLESFVKVFAKLELTVIMRFQPGPDWVMEIPGNVHMMEWVPQQEILGTRNYLDILRLAILATH